MTSKRHRYVVFIEAMLSPKNDLYILLKMFCQYAFGGCTISAWITFTVKSLSNLRRVIHAVISSAMNYCNSVYKGITQATRFSLQLIQNTAASLLSRPRKRDHLFLWILALAPSLIHLSINVSMVLPQHTFQHTPQVLLPY